MTEPMLLRTPTMATASTWIAEHMGDLFRPGSTARVMAGGQQAADAALAASDLAGYAKRRNEVWPVSRRGATGLSAYIRHGLLTLPRVWASAEHAPDSDRKKFRDELLWQEYARHLYARIGRESAKSLRYSIIPRTGDRHLSWPEGMSCVDDSVAELAEHGWITNQQRMWLASHWSVRLGWSWRDGEDLFFQQLLDGSRAANRAGWQWTVGALTGKPYGFSRWQVEKRAPDLCRRCSLRSACPIESWPPDVSPAPRADPDPRLRHDPDPMATTGPLTAQARSDAEHAAQAVWLTAESLGDDDPALAAHPDLPVMFIWDEPLLQQLKLSAHRGVFLAQCLADLAQRREVHIWRGDPRTRWTTLALATTYAPVPGWTERAAAVSVTQVHPWPWLFRPHAGPIQSFTAWRSKIGDVPLQP
ncbi:MAG: FAD-binding domain-containing protein [Candidatus Nanopelagicales bacterium]